VVSLKEVITAQHLLINTISQLIKLFKILQDDNTDVVIDGPSDVFQYHLKGKSFNTTLLQEQRSAATYIDSLTRYSNDTNIFILNSGTDMQVITALFSRLHFIPWEGKGALRWFHQGGELCKATKNRNSFWNSQPQMKLTLNSEKHSFIEFKSIVNELGPIQRNDMLFISIIDSSLSTYRI
jgi:hypothetical protein